MAKVIELSNLGAELEGRIRRRVKTLRITDPKAREALLRIGLLIEAEAKQNIRRKGIIDTGRLLNSIRSELFQTPDRIGVRVGSFGVPYASMHEFGGPFTDPQRRAMFSSLRDRGRLGPVRSPGKGIIQGNRFTARPYLRPALQVHRNRILNIIRGLLG